MRKRRRPTRLQPPPPPPKSTMEDTAAGFNGLPQRMARPANELKLRCTELDEHGNVTMVSGEFKKTELIAKVRFGAVRGS